MYVQSLHRDEAINMSRRIKLRKLKNKMEIQ